MKQRLILMLGGLLFLFVSFSVFLNGNIQAKGDQYKAIEGHWEGLAASKIGHFGLVVDFLYDNNNLQGTIGFPDNNLSFIPLRNIVFEQPRIHFEMPQNDTRALILEGVLEKKVIHGTFVDGDFTSTFTLKRLQTKPQTAAMPGNVPNDTKLRSYVKLNKSQVTIEIPKALELYLIAVAITDYGLNSRNLINKNTTYYQEVIKHFLPFKNHPVIAKLDSYATNIVDYLNLRTNTFYYNFDHGHLIKKDFLPRHSCSIFDKDIKRLFESFARKTNFEAFYREHDSFYRQQIAEYNMKVPVKKMWQWLESQFPNKYDTYTVIFSPLIADTHNTIRLGPEGSKLCVMFVSGPKTGNMKDDILAEVSISRVVFTEIDHNYVNPITDLYSRQVEEALPDITKWHDLKMQHDVYRSPYSVINEYLTWAVYLLYAYDNYDAETYAIIEGRVNQQMEKGRGFLRFSSFSKFCLELYKNKANYKKISDLFPELIEWFAENDA